MQGKSVMLKKNEEFVDSIIGKDEDIDEDSARAILSLYSIDVDSLTAELKKNLRSTLNELPEDSKEAHNLRRAIDNVVKYEKANDQSSLTPRDYIKELLKSTSTAFQKPVFSFHNRSDGQIPDEDRLILDQLKEELNDDSEDP